MCGINRTAGLKVPTCSFCKISAFKIETMFRFQPLVLFCNVSGKFTLSEANLPVSLSVSRKERLDITEVAESGVEREKE